MAPSPLTPSSLAWKAIFKGANYDASNDQQSSSDHDLVGNEKNAVLEGQTSGSGDATMLYFRARMGDEAPRTSVMLGIDINQDGRFDLFVEANVRDSDPTKYYISLHKSDPSMSGVSPSTTGWLNSSKNTLIERPLVSSRTYLSVASAGGDIDANGKTDAWISFGFSFSDLKAFVKEALGIDTFSLSTPVALSVFTSGGQTANGDVAGVSGISTRSWESLGILTTNTLTGFASGTPATPTIDPFSTSDTKPTINGSWGGTNGGTDTLSVTVNKETYTTSTTPALVISGTNWSLTLPTTAEGTYDITATATRSGGTTSSTTLSSGMTVVAAGDVTAPTLVSVLPTDDSKAVEVGSNFVMTFSENVVPGPGSITLYQGSNIVEVFSLHTGLGSFGGTAVISGKTITINPGVLLSTSTAYNVQVDADAVTDTSGNLFAELATDTAWNFTTDASLGAPTTPTVTALMTNTAAPTIGGTWGGINGGTDSLSVAVGGTTYTTSNGLSVSGTTWSLAVPTLAEGTYSVTVTASRSGGSTSKDATSNELVIDTTAPTIATFTASGTGITSGSGAVHAGDVVTITLTGSEILSVTGTPTLTLGNGATATYTGGSGTTALTFTYTVGAGDTTTADLTVTAVSTGIEDQAGNALSTSNLGSVGNPTGTLEVTSVPSAGNPVAPAITALLTNSTTPTVSGTWGGTNSGTDALSVTVGGTTYTTANGLSVSGTTWSLALPALAEGTYSVTVTASRTGGGTSSDTTTDELVIDTTAPAIAGLAITGSAVTSGGGTLQAGDTVTITLNGSEILTVSGTPTLTLCNGATATYTGGSGTNDLTFTYTVGAGDATTADLTVTAVSGGITDRAGNALSTSNLGIVGNPSGTLSVTTAICYLRGTRILTDRGEVPVETLAIGDTVVTRWGGLRPIKWIGRQSFGGNIVDWRGAPVRIAAGALGGGLPRRDLWISPGHSMLVNETLLMGHSLVNGVTIVQDDSLAQVDYFQIELETHDCVLAEGAWSETYADCRGLRGNFHNAAEFHALHPGHVAPETVALCAPRPETGPALDAALRPLVARAAAEVAPGKLNAWIDRVSDTGRVSGWAVDTANPHLPVLLEVVLGEEVLGTVLAANYRHDLFAARVGRGRCGYVFEANRRLTPQEQLSVSVRRQGDGAAAILPAEARARILDEAAAPLARVA